MGPGASLLSRPPFSDERQARIYQKLRLRVGDGPALFYREACLIREDPRFTTTSHLIAHLLREVESSLRAVTLPENAPLPDKCLTCGNRPEAHKTQIIAIAQAYQLGEQIQNEWIRLAVRKQLKDGSQERGLNYFAHRDALEYPRPFNDHFKQFCIDLDALFDLVLAQLEIQTEKIYQLLDQLLQKDGTEEDVKDLQNKAPNNLVAYRYFFERLEKSEWLAALEKKGLFDLPVIPVDVEDSGQPIIVEWPQSHYYLKRMASVAAVQEAVLKITLRLAETEHPSIRQDVVDIALQLPPEMAAQLALKIQDWEVS